MELNGLHLLLTYQCTFECDHCFVWGSPWQTGTMSIDSIREILRQARDLSSIEWIYFEGGEPFLYYQSMLQGIKEAKQQGFKVGIVSNGYWATSQNDARLFLLPLSGLVDDLTVSSDLFHYAEKESRHSKYIQEIAQELNIPSGVITIEKPEITPCSSVGQIPEEEVSVMYRGRAAEKLVSAATLHPASQFDHCPHEDLVNPGRVHIDPFGSLNLCQGIVIGNLFATPLSEICATYSPESHPIIGPLLLGGPFELARQHQVSLEAVYADACHLCYQTRLQLRNQFPGILQPDQMYGVME